MAYKTTGIYKIYFLSDPDKIYIGSAVDFNERQIRHKYQLKKGIHKNTHLQRLYNKLGEHKIVFELIEKCDRSDLLKLEQIWIDRLNPKINILRKAGSCLGYKHTEDAKSKISKANSGVKMTAEQNIKNALMRKGNKNAAGAIRSVEFKKRLSLLKMRKVYNSETMFVYPSINEAANSIGLKYNTLYAKLSGRNINNTKLLFYGA